MKSAKLELVIGKSFLFIKAIVRVTILYTAHVVVGGIISQLKHLLGEISMLSFHHNAHPFVHPGRFLGVLQIID